MFIRWQTRKRKRAWSGRRKNGELSWSAILCESARVGGKSVQRHVAYLGGFTESMLKVVGQRCFVWDRVTKRLDSLGKRITPDERTKIEAAIEAKVPRPTADEYMATAHRYAELMHHYLVASGAPIRAAVKSRALPSWVRR